MADIRHVFVLMLENHSFDNIFAMSAIPGIKAGTAADKNSYNGQEYALQDGAPTFMPTDPGHELLDVFEQFAGPGAVFHPSQRYPRELPLSVSSATTRRARPRATCLSREITGR